MNEPVRNIDEAKAAFPILRFFECQHLPEHLQQVSLSFWSLAWTMARGLPICAETSAGLRKLLEAKDCFVRAALPLLLIVLGVALAACGGKTPTPPPVDPCAAAKIVATTTCALQPNTDVCTKAQQAADSVCGVKPTCPATCPAGSACTDPAKGCVPLDCQTQGCPAGQSCVKLGETQPPIYVCAATNPPPLTCPTGQHLEGGACVADQPPPSSLPAAQPYLDDTKLTQDTSDSSTKFFGTLNDAVKLYQQKEPSHWSADLTRLTVPVATGYQRLSAWLRPTVAAQSTVASSGWVSGELYLSLAPPRFEAYLVFAGDGKWNNTTGSFRGTYYYDAPPPTPIPPQDCKTMLCGPGTQCTVIASNPPQAVCVPQPDPLAALAPLPDRKALQIAADSGHYGGYRDWTPRVCGRPDLCAAYGYTGRNCCPVGNAPQPGIGYGRERYAMGDDSGSQAPPNVPGPAVCQTQGGRPNLDPANWLNCSCAGQGCTKIQMCNKDLSVCSGWIDP